MATHRTTRATRIWVALGAVLILAPPVVWMATSPPEHVGDLAAVESSVGEVSESSRGEVAESSRREVSESSRGEVASRPVPDHPAGQHAGGASPAASRGAGPGYTVTPRAGALEPAVDPASIRIPSIDVEAGIDRVGRTPDGEMEIPPDVARAGWYAPSGVRPGDSGTAVIAGHVDSRTQGRGAFFALEDLDVGDEIHVEDADGGVTHWQVAARTRYGKEDIPLADIFSRSGPPRLALITCGGAFDATSRSYDANVVVYAEPITATAP